MPPDYRRPGLYLSQAFEFFISDNRPDPNTSICHPNHYIADTDRRVLILHSSGSTGMPKPIYSSHRYLLGFTACHNFVDLADAQASNLSTLPLFHGYGLVAPCLSLGIGMSLVLPAPSSVPTGSSILELVKRLDVRSLMTVPSILEDIVSSQQSADIDTLAALNFVAFGGGLLKQSHGEALSSANVRLLNHYGATEIGPIAPIFIPPHDYDYQFFRVRKDMDLEIKELQELVDGRPRFTLTALPFGWTTKIVMQDELISNPQHSKSDFSAIGRKDDMIVLATGEKVIPHVLESSLSESECVKGAIAFGDGQFELGVLVEPRLPTLPQDHASFVSKIWPLIESINAKMDGHARLSAQSAVVVLTPRQSLPRSDKGSIMRKEAYRIYEAEIAQAYRDLEKSSINDSTFALDFKDLEGGIKNLIQTHLDWKLESDEWGVEDDLFELGMDSLNALKLRRLLLSSTAVSSKSLACQQRDFIYRHPTILELADALQGTIADDSENLIGTFIDQFSVESKPEKPIVILLTGSTGGLGANALCQLVKLPGVSKVICLIRKSGDLNGWDKLHKALTAQNIDPDSVVPQKVEVIQTNASMPFLGLSFSGYERLQKQVTHVLHSAWPMDFKMRLSSFRAQFKMLQNLLGLAIAASKYTIQRPRFLFISSVATVGQYKNVYGQSHIPEVSMLDVSCANSFGYGEAKYVCERIIEDARARYAREIDVSFVRVGQITGSSSTGYWNPKEHIPAMIKSSQLIGALPKINGTLAWLPVDFAAKVVCDLLLQTSATELVYHLENPIRQGWHELFATLAPLLHIGQVNILPFEEWIAKVNTCTIETESDITNPARKLLDFFDADFERMAGGDVVLDLRNTLKTSPKLQSVKEIPQGLLATYVDSWRITGFLQ
ncbi:hypothetical protein ACLMJK_003647 [Lecanora helva]